MSDSLSTLETERRRILHEFLTLGDLRPGSVSTGGHRCGKPTCRCAKPGDPGHLQFRVFGKRNKHSVGESFATPAEFEKAAREVAEFHRFQRLCTELVAISRQICQLRPARPDATGWTEQEKKRLLRFTKKLLAKPRPS